MDVSARLKMAVGVAVAGVAAAAVLAAPVAEAATGLRDERYCEVIPSVVQGSSVTTYVYNTQGLNLCPATEWDALTEAEVDQEYGSQSAQLNGPRHWVMDGLEAIGSSTPDQMFTFGGIEMRLRAKLVTPLGAPTVGEQFYVPNTVQRQTVYTYDRGQPIYELIDPDRNVYVMQSYAQIVDKNLTINQLPALGHVLNLPTGWRYRVQRPRHSIKLTATGIAHVINDNLADSYQRMNKPSVALHGTPSKCVRRTFTVDVHVGGDTASTRVMVSGRVLKRTISTDFTVTVPVSHRSHMQWLSVVASNAAGTARTHAPFLACASASRPIFTG